MLPMIVRIMEHLKIHMPSELDVDRDDYIIKVRIINMWRLPKYDSPGETYSIEMILLDEHGNRMQGSVLNKFFTLFEKFLVDRACLLIKKPSLGKAPIKYRLIDNKNKVCLTPKTTVTKCNDFKGALYGFSFKSFQNILDCHVDETCSIDIIGMLIRNFEYEDFINSEGKHSQKLPIQIQDLEGQNIYVTIWDAYATQLHNYLNSNQDVHQVVIVLQFAKFKIFNGRYSVTNSYGLSRLYINSDIDEIVTFKNSLLNKSTEETSSSLQICSSRSYSLKDEFLTNTEFNTIAELNVIVEEKSVVILGTIVCIQPDVAWYYSACKNCNHKVQRKVNNVDAVESSNVIETIIYECNNKKCNVQVVTTIPRFKIPLRVQDSTGVVSLTLFERDAKKIIKKNANELLDNYLKGVYEGFIPNELNELVGKKFAFRVQVTDFNVNKKFDVFGISKMTADAEVISELEKKLNVEQPLLSESKETYNLKNTSSFTGDNETPLSSVAKPIAAMSDHKGDLKSSSIGIKRNLLEAYDVQEDASESSTKPRKDSKVHVEKLVVPKIEK